MDELIAWLRAQLDEDERLARYLADQFADPDEIDGGWSLWGGFGQAIDRAIHVDYRRGAALRRIAAIRQIIDEYRDDPNLRWVIQVLAAALADRPGYREEWRP